jgi:hypothetical protein
MMNNYVRYRNYWRQHYAFYQSELFEVAFAEHINSMTLYELMETLEGFGEEDNDEYAPGSDPERLMLDWGKEEQ